MIVINAANLWIKDTINLMMIQVLFCIKGGQSIPLLAVLQNLPKIPERSNSNQFFTKVFLAIVKQPSKGSEGNHLIKILSRNHEFAFSSLCQARKQFGFLYELIKLILNNYTNK